MKVRELLSDKSKWTQKAFCRDKKGGILHQEDINIAACWCLDGTIQLCYPNYETRYGIRYLIKKRTGVGIWYFNDNSTYEQVMEIVRELDI